MAKLQPECMVIDGLHKNGRYPGAIPAKGVGINLISHQSGILGRCVKPLQALPNSFGKRLLGMGDTGNPPLLTKHLHPGAAAVGNYTDLNS